MTPDAEKRITKRIKVLRHKDGQDGRGKILLEDPVMR